MARFRKFLQDIRQTSTHIFNKPAPKRFELAPDELTLEPPHRSPTSYQQIHASPTIECWPEIENGSLHVRNPDRQSSSSPSPAPSPPTRSPPPPPPSLPEVFEGDDITPESFELQVTDEQEDGEPEEAPFTYPPRPSSRLEMRLEELSPLDGSLFPPVITFKDSPFPIITIQEANFRTHRSTPQKMHPLSQSQEIFPTPPLEERLTRKRRRVVETIFSTAKLAMATSPAFKPQMIRLPSRDKPLPPLPPLPRDETQRILEMIFGPAAEAKRQSQLDDIDHMLATLHSGKEEPASPNTPTNWLDYQPPTPPTWHNYLTPSPAHSPSGLAIEFRDDSSSWQLPAFWTGNSRFIPFSNHIAFPRQSLRWQARTMTLNYNGRTSRFDRDYFTHRSDRRKRFLEEDWEHWVERRILAKKLARRISLMLDNLGEFSVDFGKWAE